MHCVRLPSLHMAYLFIFTYISFSVATTTKTPNAKETAEDVGLLMEVTKTAKAKTMEDASTGKSRDSATMAQTTQVPTKQADEGPGTTVAISTVGQGMHCINNKYRPFN